MQHNKTGNMNEPQILFCLLRSTILFSMISTAFMLLLLQKTSDCHYMLWDDDKTFNAAFSHRDSNQNEPLLNALSAGISYIEFDVHYMNGDLLVCHDTTDCNEKKTLQSLYLQPLKRLIESKKLSHPIYLYVDIKSDATQTYRALHDLIRAAYADMVTSWQYGHTHGTSEGEHKRSRLVNVVVTGHTDIAAILGTPNETVPQRFVSIDGRVKHIADNTMSNEYMPMISDNFQKVFPRGLVTKADKHRLARYIAKCRAKKQKLRFWNTADSERLWQQLIDLDAHKDVMVINTEDHCRLTRFLANNGY